MSKDGDFENGNTLGKRPRGQEQNDHNAVESPHTNDQEEISDEDDEHRQDTKAMEEFQRPPPSKIMRYHQEVDEEDQHHHLHHAHHLSEVGRHLMAGNNVEEDAEENGNDAEAQRYFHQHHTNLEYLQMMRDQQLQHHSLQDVGSDEEEEDGHHHHHQLHHHHRQDLHHPLHLQHQLHLQQHDDEEDEEERQRHHEQLQVLHLLQQQHLQLHLQQQQNHQDHIRPPSPHPHDYHHLQAPLVHPHHPHHPHHHQLHQTEKVLTGHLSYPHMEELDPNAYPPHPEELHLSHPLQNAKDLPLHLQHLHHHLHQTQEHQHELQLQHQIQEEDEQHHHHHQDQDQHHDHEHHDHQEYQHQGAEQHEQDHGLQQQQQQQQQQGHIEQYPILAMPLPLSSLVGSKIPLHSLPSFSSARLTPRTTKAKLGRPPKSKNKPPPEIALGDALHDPSSSSSSPTIQNPSSNVLQSSDPNGTAPPAVVTPSSKRGPRKKTKDTPVSTKQKKNRSTLVEDGGTMLQMHLDMQLDPQGSLDQVTDIPAPQSNAQGTTGDQEAQPATKDVEESAKEDSLIPPPVLSESTPSKRKATGRKKNDNDDDDEDEDDDDDGDAEGEEGAEGIMDDARKYNFQVQWDAKYQELVDYKNKYGHTNVPREWKENKTLGVWVRTQRRQRKSGKLCHSRTTKLEEIGFSWHAPRPPTWEETFEELKVFKQEYGHCCVPRFFPANQKLAAWVQTQRRFRKTNRLRPARESLLNNIGFIWESKRYVGYVAPSSPPASELPSSSSMTIGSPLSKDMGAQDSEMMRHQEMMNHFQHIQDLQNAHEVAQHLSNQQRVQRLSSQLRSIDPTSSHIPAHIIALISSPSSFSTLSGSSLPSLLVSSLSPSSSSKKDPKDEQTNGFYRPEDAEMEGERALDLSLHTTQTESNSAEHDNRADPSRPTDRELLKDL